MAGGQKFRQPFLLGYGHVFRFNSDCSSLRCFPAGSDPLPSRGQECLSSDAHSCAFHFLVRLRVITDVGEEDAAGFLDQQETRATGKATEIANVGKMTDKQRVEPRGGEVISQFLLTTEEIHSCRVYQAEGRVSFASTLIPRFC